MKQTKFVLIDSLSEFHKHFNEINLFVESASIKHTYKIHPKYITERYKNERLNVVLMYVGTQLSAYIVFNLINSTFDLRLSVKKLFGIKVEQANYVGSIILKHIELEIPVLINAISLVLKTNHLARIINFNEIRLDSDAYKTLISNHVKNCKLFNISEKIDIETELKINTSFEKYLSGFKAKLRYNLNRNVIQFKKSSKGNFEIKKIRQIENISGFYTDLEKVYINTWQAATFGYRPRNTSIETGLSMLAAEQGWFRSYILYLASEPIAYAIGYQYQDTYYLDEIGYDINYKNMTPGNVLIYYAIEDIMTNDVPTVINFGYGENLYKKLYGNTEVPATNVLLVKTNSLMLMFVKLQLFVNVIYRIIYRLLKKYNLDGFFRKILKHR